MGLAFLITSLLGITVSMFSSYEQGLQASRILAMNANMAEQKANLATQKAEIQKTLTAAAAARERKKTAQYVGAQRAAYSKAGVAPGEGTPLFVAEDTASEVELDAMAMEMAGTMEEANIISRAGQYRMDAKMRGLRGYQAKTAGTIGAGSELLTGIGQFVNSWKKDANGNWKLK